MIKRIDKLNAILNKDYTKWNELLDIVGDETKAWMKIFDVLEFELEWDDELNINNTRPNKERIFNRISKILNIGN